MPAIRIWFYFLSTMLGPEQRKVVFLPHFTDPGPILGIR
jgi:hypothetical protein